MVTKIDLDDLAPQEPGWYICQGRDGTLLLCEIRQLMTGHLWAMDPKPKPIEETSRRWSRERIVFIGEDIW